MPRESIVAPDIYPVTGYPHAVKMGNTIYTVGLVGRTADGKVPSDFEGQCRLAWQNMERVLAAAGAKMEDVVTFNQYLTDAGDSMKAIEIRRTFFKDTHRCGTLVIVKALARADLRYEINAVAIVE